MRFAKTLLALAAFAGAASGQLAGPNEAGVSMGAIWLNVTDVEVQKRFWVDSMGGTAIKAGPYDAIKFPDVIVILRKNYSSGGSKGSSVDHLGFLVRDVRALHKTMKAQGVRFVTQTEVSGGRAKGDYWFNPPQKTYQAFIMGPDDVKIELTEDPSLAQPVAHHHVHFFTPDVPAIKDWYVKTFAAVGGQRGQFQAADLPGVNLTFSEGQDRVPTKGRAVDKIGFEVRNLKEFCKRLEKAGVKFDKKYTRVKELGVRAAWLTDPWGTSIELTEGFNRL